MSVARSLPILVSLVVSTGLWIWGASLAPAEKGGAYGTLVCGEDIPDREIRERLEAQGFTGIVSESGQWVLVDSFGSVERVSLDEYAARVLPFDPRNDGYAEKLHSLFVRDKQRFLYIPLNFPVALKPVGIENRLAAALGDIPFSFHTAAGRSNGLFLALFCLTAFSFFFMRPLRMTLRPHAACLLPLLPALAPLALGGAAGFALASLLAGCAALLAGPYLQWRIMQPRRQEASAQAGQAPALCRLLPPIFLIFYGVITFFSGLPLVFILPVSVFFCVMMAFQLQTAYREAVMGDAGLLSLFRHHADHRRFTPVPIFSRRYFTFAFSWAMLPFALVALVLAGAGLAVSPAGPAVAPIMLPPADTVTEADYNRHYRFQSTFSLRSLNAPDHDMSIYELAPDGLLNESKIITNETDGDNPDYEGFARDGFMPPFPLSDVVRYLSTAGRVGGAGGVHTLLAALLPLLFVFPVLFRGGWLINQTYWGTLLKRFA
jgi:hypothetical protein